MKSSVEYSALFLLREILCEWLPFIFACLAHLHPPCALTLTHTSSLFSLSHIFPEEVVIFFPSYLWVWMILAVKLWLHFWCQEKKTLCSFIDWKKRRKYWSWMCLLARSNQQCEIILMGCDSMDSYGSSLNSYVSLTLRSLFFLIFFRFFHVFRIGFRF